MDTAKFQHDVEVAELVPDREKIDEGQFNQWKRNRVMKVATFKELDENDRDQHLLHFKIADYFSGEAAGDFQFKIADGYEMTRLFVSELLIPDETFTAKDKELLLGNSRSLLKFSFWAMKEKIIPFFRELMPAFQS